MKSVCNNCGDKNLKFLYETTDYITTEKFKIHKCNNCDLLFPLDYPEDINKYYPKKYRSYIPLVKKIIDIKSKLYIENVVKNYSKNSNNLKNKVLEIGCGDGSMLAANITMLLAIIAWTGTCSTFVFGILYKLNLLRVKKEVEDEGMDISEHGIKPTKAAPPTDGKQQLEVASTEI